MAKGGHRVGSGRKRVPAELRVIEGTFRKDRHGDPPKVSGGFPPAPSALSAAELKLWNTFPKPTWIGETDGLAVHAAVSVYARILASQVKQRAREVAGLSATDQADSLVNQEQQLWGRLMSILGTLGLTPADRAKMHAPRVDDKSDDKWAGIL